MENLKKAYKLLDDMQTLVYNELKKTRTFKYGRTQTNLKRMSLGNSKLHSILIFDMLEGLKGSCKFDCEQCYAKKSSRMYINSEQFKTVNYFMAKNHETELEIILRIQLKVTNIKTVRIHSSGDFFSNSYINMWERIIKDFPHIKFYAYTKSKDFFDFDNICKLQNFNLIDSFAIINNQKVLNYGNEEHIEKLVKQGYFLCPATKNDWKGKCGKECFYCITNDKVCFNQH